MMTCTTLLLNPPCQQLEAENARLKEELAASESLRAKQCDFYVSAAVDARRYRYLRELSDSKTDECWLVRDAAGEIVLDLQTAIDRAMKENEQ